MRALSVNWLHCVVVLVPAAIALAAYYQPLVPAKLLFLDPLVAATVTDNCCQTYLGIISNLGVFLWFITAATCLFAAYILFTAQTDRKAFEFSLLAGLLTAWLALDDAFLFHENIAPKIEIPQTAVLLAIAGFAFAYVLRCWRLILSSDVVLFAFGLGFLFLSLVIDVAHPSTSNLHFALEDGAKLIGICCWSIFHILTSARLCRASYELCEDRVEAGLSLAAHVAVPDASTVELR